MNNPARVISGIAFSLLCLTASATETIEYKAAEYENACGPISAFVAMRSMGLDVDLRTVAEECGWSDGAYVGAENVVQALRNHPSLDVRAARLSVEALASHLRNGGVAIVLVSRRSSIPNHALCLVATNGNGFDYVDMPEGKGTLDREQLAEVWSGEVILVSQSWKEWIRSEWPLLLFPAAVLLICLAASANSFVGWISATLKRRFSRS